MVWVRALRRMASSSRIACADSSALQGGPFRFVGSARFCFCKEPCAGAAPCSSAASISLRQMSRRCSRAKMTSQRWLACCCSWVRVPAMSSIVPPVVGQTAECFFGKCSYTCTLCLSRKTCNYTELHRMTHSTLTPADINFNSQLVDLGQLCAEFGPPLGRLGLTLV